MAIFKCDGCGLEKQVPDVHLGKRVRCPECSYLAQIKAEGAAGEEDLSVDDVQKAVSTTEGKSPDVICPACGAVNTAEGKPKPCHNCGRPLLLSGEEEPTEDDIRLEDLAESEVSPRIWEGNAHNDTSERETENSFIEKTSKRSLFFSGGMFQNLYAGCVSGLVSFFFAVVYGVLGSSQVEIPGFMPLLVCLALVSSIIIGLAVSLRSRIPFAIGGPDAVLVGLLFLFLGSIYRTMEGQQPLDVIFPTLVVAVAVACFVTGVGVWIMGAAKAGHWVRYIPTQILGGLYGAMGAMVLLGAWSVISVGSTPATNQFVFVGSLLGFLDGGSCDAHWIPSVAFALLLFGAMYRTKNSLVLLAFIMAGVGIGHAAVFFNVPHVGVMLGSSLSASFGGIDYLIAMFDPHVLSRIDWHAISQQNLYLGTMAGLTLLRMMARSSHIEAFCDIRVDLANEYSVVGGGGMLSAFAGGMPGSISYGRTMGNYALGARGRLSGVVSVFVCMVLLFYSRQALSMVPRFVAEGLLIYIGLGLIKAWLFDTVTTFTRRDDRRLALLVFFIALVFGMLAGIGIGVALAMLLTVSRYSRDGAIKNELSGAYYRSNVDRAPAQLRILKEYGDHIYILRLKGFMFLGTLYDVIDRIRSRIRSADQLPMEYIVLDFSLVSGFASATDTGFSLLRDLALEEEVNIILTSPPLELADHLERAGYVLNDVEGSFKIFMNLDYALEWCENQILDGENHADMRQQSLPELLAPVFHDPRYIPLLLKVLKKVHVKKDEVVMEQGDYSDTMYFVESGTLNVLIKSDGDKAERVKKVGPGAVFGEMGFYTDSPRSATVQAAEKCVLYLLDRKKMALLEKRIPALATAFNRYLVNVLSERLVTANKKALELR